jgi:hypothetical protein
VRNPLSYVEFVELVVFNAMLQESVDELADTSHGTSLGQIVKLILRLFSLKWNDDNVYKQVYNLNFSQELLILHNGHSVAMKWVFAICFDNKEYQSL